MSAPRQQLFALANEFKAIAMTSAVARYSNEVKSLPMDARRKLLAHQKALKARLVKDLALAQDSKCASTRHLERELQDVDAYIQALVTNSAEPSQSWA